MRRPSEGVEYFLMMVVGVILELTYLTSPIHEMGHLLVGLIFGADVSYGWRSTFYYPSQFNHFQNIVFSYAGWMMEYGFFLFFANIFAKKGRYLPSGICLGVSLAALITAKSQQDMLDINYAGFPIIFFIASAVFLRYSWRIHQNNYISRQPEK